jgi:queuosine biosynthesis protein QueD
MLSITKEYHICAAHWLPFHKGKCSSLHGHNYRFIVTIEGYIPNPNEPFLMDFANLKKICDEIIGVWDHKFLVHYTQDEISRLTPGWLASLDAFGIQPSGIVPLGFFTTAENLAKYASEAILNACPDNVLGCRIECFETLTSSASASVFRQFDETNFRIFMISKETNPDVN